MATTDLPAGGTGPADLDGTDLGVLDVGPDVAYVDVPDAGPDAELDPHWIDLRSGAILPAVYMPPAMAGPRRRPRWLQTVAVGLVAMFLLATVAGVCLTYGPPHFWR